MRKKYFRNQVIIFAITVVLAIMLGCSVDSDGDGDDNQEDTTPPYSGDIYVRESDGDDNNPGSQDEPKKTIQAAIDVVDSLYTTADVYVAEGTYVRDYNTDRIPVVLLKEGISIYGGYSDSDWSIRDPLIYITIIKDSSANNGTLANPNRAIDGDGSSTSITDISVIDGFTINGGGGDYSSAIFNHNGSSPTIQNNVINGGNCDGNSFGILNYECDSLTIQNNTINGGTSNNESSSYAIYNYECSSLNIQNNTLDGGTGGSNSYGIYNYYSSSTIQNNIINGGAECISSIGIYNHYSSSPMILNNIINGGTGNHSCGINNANSTPTIKNNTIDGGIGHSTCSTCGIHNYSSSSIIQNNVIDGGKSGSFSHGINNFSSSPVIRNNTILGGNGWISTYGIQIYSASSPTIENNIIFTSGDGSRYGIHENGEKDDPISVRNNDIYDCPNGLYYDYDSSPEKLTEIDDVNNLSDITSSGNIYENISGYMDAEFRFTGALGDFIFDTEGINGAQSSENWGFTTDKDDNSRSPLDDSSTTGWSIGAYEY